MSETHQADHGQDAHASLTRTRPPGAPRWVKAFAALGLVLLVLLAAIMLGGGHGPTRHASSGQLSGQIRAADLVRSGAVL